MFNATINNISVISWRQFYWWRKPEYPEKTTDLTWETRGAINAEKNAIGKSKIIQNIFFPTMHVLLLFVFLVL
jgi:hypothetical protein